MMRQEGDPGYAVEQLLALHAEAEAEGDDRLRQEIEHDLRLLDAIARMALYRYRVVRQRMERVKVRVNTQL